MRAARFKTKEGFTYAIPPMNAVVFKSSDGAAKLLTTTTMGHAGVSLAMTFDEAAAELDAALADEKPHLRCITCGGNVVSTCTCRRVP